jgi:hypothetical protein
VLTRGQPVSDFYPLLIADPVGIHVSPSERNCRSTN